MSCLAFGPSRTTGKRGIIIVELNRCAVRIVGLASLLFDASADEASMKPRYGACADESCSDQVAWRVILGTHSDLRGAAGSLVG